MAWWNRRPPRTPASVHRAEGVVAAAQRFDLANPADREALGKLQQQWQQDILIYADTIGEFKDAGRFVENAFRRIRLFAAFQRTQDEEPVPVMDATKQPDQGDPLPAEDLLDEKWAVLAEDILDGFAARDGGQPALMARLGVNIFYTGEVIVIQRAVPERRAMPGEDADLIPRVWDWEVRSVFEVRASQSDRRQVEVIDAPDQRKGTPIEGMDGVPPYVERIYRRHQFFSSWADSNARAAVDVLETMRLLGLVERSSLRSRIMAGWFKVPEELDFGATDLPDGTPGPVKAVSFDRTMAEAMGAGISNEADPNNVAPLVVRGSSKFLGADVFGPVEMPRRYGADERAQREDAVRRLGRTIELPQELAVGTDSQNHWNVWEIEERVYRAYIEPLALVGTDGLTFGLLRPLMLAEGCPPEVLDRIIVLPDASQLVRRSDIGKIATEGYTMNPPAVGASSWRRHNGLGDDDAPTDEDYAMRAALAARQSPEVAASLLEQVGILDEAPAPAPVVVPVVEPDDEQPVGDNSKQPPAQAASALEVARSSTVGSRLAAIDSTLFARLLTQADQTVTRILEKIGAGLRSRNGKANAELRAALSVAKDVPNADLAARLPVALVAAALGPTPVTADDFDDLRVRFDRWTDAAQETAVRELARLAGDQLTDAQIVALREQQADDRDEAWLWLVAALVAYTQSRLVRAENVVDEGGEWDAAIVVAPGVIREALALAGGSTVEHTTMGGVEAAAGGPVGGVATGDTMRLAFGQAGHPFTGYEWEYGAADRQTPFEPHLALDGDPASEWGPYLPGDHRWCRCGMTVTVAEGGGT